MNSAAVVFILVAILQAGNGALIKIKLHPESKASAELDYKRQAQVSNACEDVVTVERASVINDLPGNASQLDSRVTFWRSPFLTNMLTAIQRRTVPGLDGATVADVFAVMRNQSCFPFIFGGAVRDQFLGVPIDDVDASVDCDRATALQICIDNWGTANCDSGFFLTVGDSGLVALAEAEIFLFGPLAGLEYTANSISYDTSGTDAILDVTRTGVVNACNRTIRIPSDDDSEASWDAWRDDNKIRRFWRLRENGFSAVNAATQEYIARSATAMIETNPNDFYDFYCDRVYDSEYDASEMVCVDLPEENCAQGEVMRELYDRLLTEDLGEVWSSRTPPIIPQCASAAAIGATITTMIYVAAMLFLTLLI